MKRKPKIDLVHLSNAQIAEIKSEINGLEAMLSHPDDHIRNKITDPEGVKKLIRKRQELLKVHTPKKLTGKSANKAYERAKELKEKIAEAMPTRGQYYQREPRPGDGHGKHRDFEEAVKQQMAFQTNPGLNAAVLEYKSIMRQLDPSDPTIANIENLRR